jgi:hypothetical protein
MKFSQAFIRLSIPVLCLSLAVACDTPATNNASSDTANVKDSATSQSEADETHNTLPSPLHIARMFRSAGLKYLPEITSPADKVASYTTTISRALNMGIYSSDLAYCTLNKQSNESQKYLKNIRTLADQINLGKIFAQTGLYDRFNSNLNKEDSLTSIITDIQFQTDALLEQNEQNHLYGILFSGAWVESMHLGGEVYRKEPNEDLVSTLLTQMGILKSIMQELEIYKQKDPSIGGVVADLSQLQEIFQSIPAIQKISADPEADFASIKLTKEEITPLIDKITEIRTKIINNNNS